MKRIVREVTGDKGASVRSGSGTSSMWWYIKAKATKEQRDEVERRCNEEKLLGHYFTDHGVNDGYENCVSWDT